MVSNLNLNLYQNLKLVDYRDRVLAVGVAVLACYAVSNRLYRSTSSSN